jgi:hypothetical protein
MSEKQPTKPRRDLRARLGKTITPKTAGAEEAAATPDVAAAAPAAVAAPTPVKAPAVKPPAGIAAPPAGIAAPPFGATPDVAPPPFARPAAAPEPIDPFGSSAAAVPQQVVRLEFDDKLVTDQETGKTGRTLVIIAAVASLVVGAGIGWGIGSQQRETELFNRTVADAQAIHAKVDGASSILEQAQLKVNAIIAAAAGNATTGTAPSVDYDSITALRALEKPFQWSDFTSRNYNALTGTVHDLMQYTQNIAQLWELFGALAGETLAEARRAELDRTAAETAEGASTQYGAVLVRNDEGLLVGQLAFLEPAADGKVLARPTRGGQGREFSLFNDGADQDITDAPALAMLIDGAGSRGVLAEQTGAFGRFLQRITEIKRLIDSTIEIQGRLLTAISTALSEAGAPVRAAE